MEWNTCRLKPKREVIQLYGNGVLINTFGQNHRYYTDPKHQITVDVAFGTDKCVEYVDIHVGFDPPMQIRRPDYSKLVSQYLERSQSVDQWLVLHLGSSPEKIKDIFGSPKKVFEEHGETHWVYSSTCHCELDSGIAFIFKNNQVICYSVWADLD